MNIKDAVENPRFHHQWLPDAISFEYEKFSNETLLNLEDRGHSYYFRKSIGEANSIKIKYLENSDKVKWIVCDINEFIPENSFDFWHDRAVFHFLTSKKNISNYAKMVSDYATNFVVGTFSTDGPTKCSGLDICQYNEMSITKTFETSNFKKVESKRVDHKTPFGTTQNFIFCSFTGT